MLKSPLTPSSASSLPINNHFWECFNSFQTDKIVLDQTTFSAIASAAGNGFSQKSDFQVTSSAGTSTARIVYDPSSGQLFYNQNGSTAGFGSGGLFANLTGAPTLTASDFVVVA